MRCVSLAHAHAHARHTCENHKISVKSPEVVNARPDFVDPAHKTPNLTHVARPSPKLAESMPETVRKQFDLNLAESSPKCVEYTRTFPTCPELGDFVVWATPTRRTRRREMLRGPSRALQASSSPRDAGWGMERPRPKTIAFHNPARTRAALCCRRHGAEQVEDRRRGREREAGLHPCGLQCAAGRAWGGSANSLNFHAPDLRSLYCSQRRRSLR